MMNFLKTPQDTKGDEKRFGLALETSRQQKGHYKSLGLFGQTDQIQE